MWARPDTRVLWWGIAVVASIAVTSLWYSASPTRTQKENKAPSGVNNDALPSPAPHKQRSPRPLSRHRSPEDDVCMDALHDLLVHPSHAIRTAATRLVLTRLLRHRSFAQKHRRYLDYRCVRADNGGDMEFHRSIAVLESYGWAGSILEDGEMQIEAIPEGVWEGLVRGYSGWAEDWDRRYGVRVEMDKRAGSEEYIEDGDLVGAGKL